MNVKNSRTQTTLEMPKTGRMLKKEGPPATVGTFGTPTTEGTTTTVETLQTEGMEHLDPSKCKYANYGINAKIAQKAATAWTLTEGTPKIVETSGTEGMSTTAGSQQQQKHQQQHEC